MNHSFRPSNLSADKCQICKWPEIQHTKNAVCDACPNVGEVTPNPKNTMLLCNDCWKKESQTIETIPLSDVLTQVKEIDSQVEYKTDIFNAATVAITDLKKLIDADETIENKPFVLASQLKARYDHFKTVIFEAQKKITEAANEQRAIQVYLNQLANSLRMEEREKLKINDINYKPAAVKPAKVTVSKPKVKKLDKNELRKIAAENNIPEFILQQTAVQKNIDLKEAAAIIVKQIADMKAKRAAENNTGAN